MKVSTTVRLEENNYKSAKEVLSRFGLSFSDGVNMFIAKMSMVQGIPFDLSISNNVYSEETLDRVKNIENGKNLEKFDSAEALFDNLGI